MSTVIIGNKTKENINTIAIRHRKNNKREARTTKTTAVVSALAHTARYSRSGKCKNESIGNNEWQYQSDKMSNLRVRGCMFVGAFLAFYLTHRRHIQT